MIKIATSQFNIIKNDFNANLNKAIDLILSAAKENVDILLLQELFQDFYFCSTQNIKFFEKAIASSRGSIPVVPSYQLILRLREKLK